MIKEICARHPVKWWIVLGLLLLACLSGPATAYVYRDYADIVADWTLPSNFAYTTNLSPILSFTFPKRKLLIPEETPKKKKGIRKHFDVLGSKWNIRSPVPRPGISPITGPQLKNELKIYNLMKSRKRETYEIHGPFEKIEVLMK